jgi:hypothetical protein
MSVGLRISIEPKNLKGLTERKRQEIERRISPSIDKTASLGKQIILTRTKKGVGIGGPFKRYSPAYVRFRSRPRRRSPAGNLLGLGKSNPNLVNLNATGDMVKSVQVEGSKGGRIASIYLAGKFNAQKAFWTDRQRPWWGFNNQEESRLTRFFRKEILR